MAHMPLRMRDLDRRPTVSEVRVSSVWPPVLLIAPELEPGPRNEEESSIGC